MNTAVERVKLPSSPEQEASLLPKRRKTIAERVGSKNKFYCGGRGLSGPDRFAFVAAVLITVIPNVCYFIFEAAWMWSFISPAIPIIQAWLFLTIHCLHLITAFSDPGIIPRVLEDENADADDNNPWRRGRAMPPQTRNIDINGASVQTKWCRTCQIQRPPRAVHCGVCDNCVDRFDHHCPWTGNCVGRRNYRWFLYFVTLVPVMCLYTLGALMAKLIILSLNSPNTGWQAFWEAVTIDPAAPIIGIVCLVPLCFVGFLALYHAMLSALDETTNERLKGAYRNGNPYSRGVLRNCFGRWCGYTLPRYVKFHVTHMEDLTTPALPDAWLPPSHSDVELVSVALDSGHATPERELVSV